MDALINPIYDDRRFAAELDKIFYEMSNRNDAIELAEAMKAEDRQVRRQARMRVGGFGIAGMLEAAAINAASGALHATFNAVQASGSAIGAHGDRRRLMDDSLAAVQAVVCERLALLADGVLRELVSHGVALATTERADSRRLEAAAILQQVSKPGLAVAVQSLQLSVIENYTGLGIVATLLKAPDWEARLKTFSEFIERNGPDDFFVSAKSPGSALLAACVRRIVRIDSDVGASKATRSALADLFPEWWKANAAATLTKAAGSAIVARLSAGDDAATLSSVKAGLAAVTDLNELEVMAAAGDVRAEWIRRGVDKAIRDSGFCIGPRPMRELLYLSDDEVGSVIAFVFHAALLEALEQHEPSVTLALLSGMQRLDADWHTQFLDDSITTNEAVASEWLKKRVPEFLYNWQKFDLTVVGECISGLTGINRRPRELGC